MASHQDEKVRKIYGNLLALYFLSNKIEDADFWEKVAEMDGHSLSSVCQVFSHNADNHDCGDLCIHGLEKVLGMPELPSLVKTEVELVFSHKDLRLPATLALSYISHIDGPEDRLFRLAEWLGQQSKHEPENVLQILEALFQKLHQIQRERLWHSDGLVTAAINILRHADFMDDVKIITRAIVVQDELIRLNVDKMESALEDAARE